MSNDQPEQIPSVDGPRHLPGDFPPPVQDSYGPPPLPAPGYGPPPVPAPGYGPPPVPAYATGAPYPAQPTDGVSIAALVTGILGLGVVPVVLGIVGLKRTKATGTSGRGMSIAGIVLGAISFVVWSIVLLGIVLAAMNVGTTANQISTAMKSAMANQPTQSAPSEPAGLDDSATPLLDAIPLTVAGFSTDGLVVNDALVGAGAVEAYTATFTDGTSSVAAVVADWASADAGLAWATAQQAGFTPDQLIDSDDTAGMAYWVYRAGDVVTVVGTNDSLAYTFVGPLDAVDSFYSDFPL